MMRMNRFCANAGDHGDKCYCRNQVRYRLVSKTQKTQSWTVIRIWEHQLSQKSSAALLCWLAKTLS